MFFIILKEYIPKLDNSGKPLKKYLISCFSDLKKKKKLAYTYFLK